MKDELKFLSHIHKLIPSISLLFFLGSLWYEGLYYKAFSINIFSYVSIYDTLILFIEKIPLLTLLSGFALAFFYILQFIFHRPLSNLMNLKRFNLKERRKKFLPNMYLTFIIGIFPMLYFMGAFPGATLKIITSEGSLIFRALWALILIFLFIHVPMAYSGGKYDDNIFKLKQVVISFILTFFCVIYYYKNWQVLKLKEKYDLLPNAPPLTKLYTIKMNDGEEISDSKCAIFIGQTNSYVFIIHPNFGIDKAETRAIKMSDIKEIKVNTYMRWFQIIP